jgi:myo-inositol 2-dehydrogenase/D-chiro-inositol 1-dehydrogenase
MRPPTFGLVGAGRWAEVHRDALQSVGAQLNVVLVSSQESAERVRRDWGVAATTDWDEFLAAGDKGAFEAAIIASPNYLHAEHAVRCLQAGRHVLVEKPMALDVAGCDAIIAAARQAGRVVAIGLEMRLFKLFERVRALIDEGAIGTPLHLRLDLWRRPYRAGAGGWKADPAKVGSSILEEPIHYLDLARWYLTPSHGEPSALQAWATSRPDASSQWQNLDVGLRFGEARALVTRSIAAWGHKVSLQLVGDAGALSATWAGSMDLDLEPRQQLTLLRGRGTAPEEVHVPQSGHAFDLPRQTAAFIAALRSGSRPAATAADGRAAVALCLAVERSLRQGGAVLLG